jgi:hypothetical protein
MAMAMKVAPSGLPTLRRRVSLGPLLLSVAEGVRRRSSRSEDEEPWSMGRVGFMLELEFGESDEVWWLTLGVMELLRRNSWVTAMPMDAKASDVRSQARNVRSN